MGNAEKITPLETIRAFIARSREIESRATPRPWKTVMPGSGALYEVPTIETMKYSQLARTTHHGKMREDATLIVHSGNTHAALLDVIERMADELKNFDGLFAERCLAECAELLANADAGRPAGEE